MDSYLVWYPQSARRAVVLPGELCCVMVIRVRRRDNGDGRAERFCVSRKLPCIGGRALDVSCRLEIEDPLVMRAT